VARAGPRSAGTATEPAPTFPAGVPPTHTQEEQHKAINQLDTDLPQANHFRGKQKAGQKQQWLPREVFAFSQLGTPSSTGLSAALQSCSNPTPKLKPDPFLEGGGEAQAQHIPPEERIFFPLPSEKGLLLPVFYETPTHQPSNRSLHLPWFYVSNKKQLHLHKTCFSNTLSARGWSGGGVSLPSRGHVS